MRVLATLIAAAMLAAGGASANEYALVRARALFEQLSDEAQCEAALPAARVFWRTSDFGTMPEEVQAVFLYALGDCAWRLEDGQAVIVSTRQAHEMGATWAGYRLMQAGIRFDDDRVAVEGFHALAQTDPETLQVMPWRFAWGAIRAANTVDPSGAEALRIHNVLEQKDYAPAEGGSTDSIRLAHARLLLAGGQVDHARRRLATVIDPRDVLTLRVDRTFDPLRSDPVFVERLDMVAAAEAHLARAAAAMEQHPERLAMVLEHAQALRTLNRNDEALAELDRYLAAAQAPDGAQRYEDIAAQLNWLLNERAYTLYDLNRPEEARAAFGESIAVGEGGQWSVSQVINFASMLVSEGHGADAIQVVSTVGHASPYGDMWAASVRACAADQTGDAAMRDEAMAFMREHADDNPAAMTNAYLCLNDLDGAAAMYVSRLANDEQRGDALVALQIYPPAERAALPYETILRQRLALVRARDDVRAAVDAVGRIEEVPLRGVYWGDV